MLKILVSIVLLSLFGLLTVKSTDLFTAMSDLEGVFDKEEKMIAAVEEYIRQERERLVKIEGKLENLRRLNREGQEDMASYLSHPFNGFLLIKRFIWEWVDLENWIKISMPSREYIFNVTGLRSKLPQQSDLDGAADALWRLQDTYKFTPASLMEGAKMEDNLKAHHSFEVGRLAYHVADDKYHAIPWMEQAYKWLNNKTKQGDFFKLNETEILDHLAYASFSEERLEDAAAFTDKLLLLAPDSKRYADNKAYYKYLLDKKYRPRGETGDLKGLSLEEAEEEEEEEEMDEEDLRNVHPDIRKYRALCRGDEGVVRYITKPMLQTCSYAHYNNPFLMLQPAKEEVAFVKPKIIVYHDIISDQEIEALKNLAKPRVGCLLTFDLKNSTSGYLEQTKFRICKSGWVAHNESEVIRRIYQRVGAYTGLSMNATEFLQIANYGLGGHYLPHFDFTKDIKTTENGNRIASMLFYLSDVTKGGATVFIDAGAKIKPGKGSAIFWYNLFRNGRVDERTKHGSCPVISGSKWVANIWMREHGQEFRRPCGIGRSE
ncbi:prolyl 4-hydroxylase subunit alpha-1-like [Lytechinus pictus]|uniref:prolyl 4-hydroxylase subunit alpha-1-like n=1 Tax=Lytechinus pictus TaxID=7653 RepID=UPI0030B9F6D5